MLLLLLLVVAPVLAVQDVQGPQLRARPLPGAAGALAGARRRRCRGAVRLVLRLGRAEAAAVELMPEMPPDHGWDTGRGRGRRRGRARGMGMEQGPRALGSSSRPASSIQVLLVSRTNTPTSRVTTTRLAGWGRGALMGAQRRAGWEGVVVLP